MSAVNTKGAVIIGDSTVVLSKESVKPQHSKSQEPYILLSIYTPLALHCYCWPGAKSMN